MLFSVRGSMCRKRVDAQILAHVIDNLKRGGSTIIDFAKRGSSEISLDPIECHLQRILCVAEDMSSGYALVRVDL